MYRQHGCRCHACAPHGGYYPGLAGIARSLFSLTVSAVRGGVRLVQTAANGAVWGPCGCEVDCCSARCRPALHSCSVECVPPVYAGCCRHFGE